MNNKEGKVGVIVFEENYINIEIYFNKTLQNSERIKKKDFTYEVAFKVMGDVTKVFGFRDKTVEDARIINIIADLEGIDLQTGLEFFKVDEEKRKLIN